MRTWQAKGREYWICNGRKSVLVYRDHDLLEMRERDDAVPGDGIQVIHAVEHGFEDSEKGHLFQGVQ